MHSKERHKIILDLVRTQDFVPIERLAELCGVSCQTLRRDFAALEERGQVTRLHGGVCSPSTTSNPAYEIRKNTGVEAKQAMATLAAGLIPHRSSLFVAGGTTMEAFLYALAGKHGLFILTTNLLGALVGREQPDWLVYVPHGRVASLNSLIGAEIIPAIDQCSMDFCVLSTGAIDSEGNFLETNYQAVAGIQAMKKNVRKIILVAENAKFERKGAARAGSLSELSWFVTDKRPPDPIVELLRHHNVGLLYPGQTDPREPPCGCTD